MKKKILSILLSVSMLTAMAVPAMAEESTPEESITTELFAEDFEGDNLVSAAEGEGTWLSTTSAGFYQDSTIFHGGKKSLAHSGTKGSVKYKGTKSVGNYVYEFWYYDNGGTGAALVDLSGTDKDGKSATKKQVFGVKTGTSKNYYMVGTVAASNIQRSVGWHHVVIDTTDNGKVTIYLDGNNVYDNKTTTVYNVTDVRFINGWQQDENKFNIDDMKAYESYADVPVYRKNVMESVKFASGVDVEGADNAVTADGDITITFKENMVTPTQENFTLLERAATSTSDADYATATVTLKAATATSATLSIEGLKSDTEYRLGFTGLTTAAQKTVATDFIEFSTAADVALERSVVDYVAFDNGARLPSTGIPETFGDLIVHFTEEMDTETLNENTVILKKEDGTVEGGTVIDVFGSPSGDTYIINSETIGLEPSTTYTLTVTTGAKTLTGNHACEDYSVTFTTSADLEHQDVIFEDSFENGWNNWNRTGHNLTEDTYHTGNKALILSQNGYVQYNGTVPTNAVYEVWLYDGGLSSENIVLQLKGEQADGTTGTIQFGTKNGYGSQYWLSDLSDDVRLGTRSVGWHRFIVDFRNPDQVNYYIDDTLVAVRPEAIKKITDVRIRNQFSTGKMIADDFKIWNAVDYDVISKVYESKAFICDENYNALVDYKAGDKVYVAVNIDNQQAASQDAVLIVAEYDKNGALSKVKSSEKTTIQSGDNVNLRIEYTIPENFEDYELKAFVWDSLDTIKPIMPASDPKEVTAVFLGGSITAGTKASEESKNYASQTGEYLKSTYGSGSDVTIVNSGVGGKGSAFGSKHFYNYVGKYNPDILFVEYAVNDRGGVEADVKKTLEQVVQKALALPKKPKIVFIYTTTKELDSCADWHGAVAQYYGIPEINLEEAVKTEIIGNTDATTWTNWETHLDDGVHPNDTGYKFYADNIIEALKGEGFLKTAEAKAPYFQQ